MTRMNYSRNHSRSLSSTHRYYGDEAVLVRCLLCSDEQPADGYHAVRVEVERGVKARLGYHGPPQVWLCRDCVETHGRFVTRDVAAEVAQVAYTEDSSSGRGADTGPAAGEVTDQRIDEETRNFWKRALGAGAVAVLIAGAWVSETVSDQE